MATDNFNRAAGALGANWTTVIGDPEIDGTNTRVAGIGAFQPHVAYYSGASVPADHYAQIVSLGGASAAEGPMVRGAAGYFGYVILATPSSIILYRLDGGTSATPLHDYSSSVTSGETLRLEVTTAGGLLSKKNTTPLGSADIDGTYPTGAPGFFLYSDTAILDDFAAEGLVKPGLNPLTGWM